MEIQVLKLFYWIYFLNLCTKPAEFGKVDRIKDAHPSDFLISSDSQNSGFERTPSPAEREAQIKTSTDELIKRLATSGADTSRASVKYILDLYKRMETGENSGPTATTPDNPHTETPVAGADVIRGLTASVPANQRHRSDVSLSFPLSGFSEDESTELAELRLRPVRHHPMEQQEKKGDSMDGRTRRQQPRLSKNGFQRLRISILDKDGDRQIERIYKVKWRRDEIDGFTVLDITHVLQEMSAANIQKFQNGSLEISLRKTRRVKNERARNGRKRRAIEQRIVHPSLNPELDAVLVLYSKSSSNKLEQEIRKHQKVNKVEDVKNSGRNKRSTRQNKKKSGRGKCAPKDMHIDFETLGWADDIIFPVRYNARFCHGRCPSPVNHDFAPTNHAILQSMMRLHDRAVKRPCCVPVAYKPLMMLYKRADGNVEIRHHPEMVVDKCGCR